MFISAEYLLPSDIRFTATQQTLFKPFPNHIRNMLTEIPLWEETKTDVQRTPDVQKVTREVILSEHLLESCQVLFNYFDCLERKLRNHLNALCELKNTLAGDFSLDFHNDPIGTMVILQADLQASYLNEKKDDESYADYVARSLQETIDEVEDEIFELDILNKKVRGGQLSNVCTALNIIIDELEKQSQGLRYQEAQEKCDIILKLSFLQVLMRSKHTRTIAIKCSRVETFSDQ
jgi:hypothetical protein